MLKLSNNISPSYLRSLPIGLDPIQAKYARNAKWTIISRCANQMGATEKTVKGTIKWTRELGAKIFLPVGDQVLGRRDHLKALVDALKSEKMYFANPEFAKIGGSENVALMEPENVVRLHSAQNAEIDKLGQAEYIERYDLAASERGIRILLLRPLSLSADKPLTSYGELVSKLVKSLERERLVIGYPHPYQNPSVPSLVFVLIAAAIGFTIFSVAQPWLKVDWHRYAVMGFLAILAVGSLMPSIRAYVALLAAIVMPLMAFLYLDQSTDSSVTKRFAIMSLISLVGGLSIAGLLNGVAYYIHSEQFEGVKLAHFLPIFIVGGYFYYRFAYAKGFSKAPVLWGHIIVGFLILGMLAFMMMRTGNDNPAGVSGIELKLRNLLSLILPVRPRTKEILLGHPMMVIAIGMMIRYKLMNNNDTTRGGWLALALMAGAIGQTSIVNTMCHIHTPLTAGLYRIVIAWIIGGGIGLVVWHFIKQLVLPIESASNQGVLFSDRLISEREGEDG